MGTLPGGEAAGAAQFLSSRTEKSGLRPVCSEEPGMGLGQGSVGGNKHVRWVVDRVGRVGQEGEGSSLGRSAHSTWALGAEAVMWEEGGFRSHEGGALRGSKAKVLIEEEEEGVSEKHRGLAGHREGSALTECLWELYGLNQGKHTP